MRKILKKIIPITLLTLYFLSSYFFNNQLVRIDAYMPYAVEVFWVIMTLMIFRDNIDFHYKFSFLHIFELLLLIGFGFVICILAKYLHIAIPINKSDPHTLILLLIVAPILEELIFRKTLFSIFERIYNNSTFIVIVTAIMFSYAHFHYIFSVGRTYQSFIIYQSVYTLVMGLWFGLRILNLKSINGTIIMHFCVNIGFLAGLFSPG